MKCKNICLSTAAVLILLLFSFAVCEEQPVNVSLNLITRLSMIPKRPLQLEGSVTSDLPIESVTAEIYDERRARIEYSHSIEAKLPSCIMDLKTVLPSNAFASLTGGEKTLTVTAHIAGKEYTADSVRFTVLGNVGAYATITKECKYTMKANPLLLYNDSFYPQYSWTPRAGSDSILIELPENKNASLMQIEWLTPPSFFRIECFDRNGKEILVYDESVGYGFYTNTFPIGSAVRSISIILPDYTSGIAALHIFAEDGPDIDIQNWAVMPEKLDLMLLSAHQDDELLFFGGAISNYSASRNDVGVFYMANCGRHRYSEALSGLWIAGLRVHPVFLGLKDANASTYYKALNYWGSLDSTVEKLVEQIRRYKPEVIVTHGEKGEYGHFQHIITSEAALLAVERAKDPAMYPDSVEEYGVWEVKKLYRHQTNGEITQMDWHKPLAAFDGRTGMEMAEIAYNRHASQTSSLDFSYGYKYDNTKFALVYSTVGADTIGGDFLENIPTF